MSAPLSGKFVPSVPKGLNPNPQAIMVGDLVPCPICGTNFANAQQAATCLCKRRRYITTLGIRYGQVPTAAQLKSLTRQSASQVVNYYNSRLSAALQANSNAAVAPHQVKALGHLGLPVPATAGGADAALIAWSKSSAATSTAVWALAQAVSAPQAQQLSLF